MLPVTLITSVALCWTLQYARIFLVQRSPTSDTVFHVWPHQCWAEAKDSLLWLASHVLTQLMILLPASATRARWSFNMCLPFLPVYFLTGWPQSVLVDGQLLRRCKAFNSLLLNCIKFLFAQFSGQLMSLRVAAHLFITHPSQFCIICCKTKGMHSPVIQVINKHAKQHWTQIQCVWTQFHVGIVHWSSEANFYVCIWQPSHQWACHAVIHVSVTMSLNYCKSIASCFEALQQYQVAQWLKLLPSHLRETVMLY